MNQKRLIGREGWRELETVGNCGDGENERREYCGRDRGRRMREGAFGRERE